jgi:hypothetical protein
LARTSISQRNLQKDDNTGKYCYFNTIKIET